MVQRRQGRTRAFEFDDFICLRRGRLIRDALTATADSSLLRIFAICALERSVLQSSMSFATSVSDHLMEVVLGLICAAARECDASIRVPLRKMAAEMLGQYHRSLGASQAKNVTCYEMFSESSQVVDLIVK